MPCSVLCKVNSFSPSKPEHMPAKRRARPAIPVAQHELGSTRSCLQDLAFGLFTRSQPLLYQPFLHLPNKAKYELTGWLLVTHCSLSKPWAQTKPEPTFWQTKDYPLPRPFKRLHCWSIYIIIEILRRSQPGSDRG